MTIDKKTNNNIYKILGASNHTDKERHANDYYATDPKSIDILCAVESFEGTIWECACGEGHLSKRLADHGYEVVSTDLINRGYGDGGIDFLQTESSMADNIVTNPPYSNALEFCEKALGLIQPGKKVAMFLRVQFLEGKKRGEFFKRCPPKTVYVSSSRIQTAKNGQFEQMKAAGGSAVAYAWFVWEKGFTGKPTIEWVN